MPSELYSLFELQRMDPILRDALMSSMGAAKTAQSGMDQMLSDLAQQALGAQERQASAETEYREALKQPPPQEGPGEVTRSLFGNIASAVSGQPQFGQQAQAANARDLSAMMERRKEQLAALHDNVTQRAAMAQQLGNLKLSTSLHMQAGQVERSLANIDKLQMAQVEQKGKERIEGIRGEYGLKEAQIRANKAAFGPVTPTVIAWANKINRGEATISQVKAADRGAVVEYMEDQGMSITDPKVRQARAMLGGAEGAIDKLMDKLAKVPADSGLARFGAGMKATGSAILQPKGYPEPALYLDEKKAFRALLARTLGHVGVLTAQDVDDAMALMPTFFASPEVRDQKFQDVKDLLRQKYQAWLSAYQLPNAGIGAPTSDRAKFGYE